MNDHMYASELGIDFDALKAAFTKLLEPKQSQFGLLRIDRERHKWKDQVQAMWWGVRDGYPDFSVRVTESKFSDEGEPCAKLDVTGELSPIALDCLNVAIAHVNAAVRKPQHG